MYYFVQLFLVSLTNDNVFLCGFYYFMQGQPQNDKERRPTQKRVDFPGKGPQRRQAFNTNKCDPNSYVVIHHAQN